MPQLAAKYVKIGTPAIAYSAQLDKRGYVQNILPDSTISVRQ